MNKISKLLVDIYCFPVYIAYYKADEVTKKKIDMDIARYEYANLGATIFKEINFRNVFY